jgi:hypothetical protein
MNRIKFFAVTALAAAAVGVGSLASPESASAQSRECKLAVKLFEHYMLQKDIMYAVGAREAARDFTNRGIAILQRGCYYG